MFPVEVVSRNSKPGPEQKGAGHWRHPEVFGSVETDVVHVSRPVVGDEVRAAAEADVAAQEVPRTLR